MESSRAVGALNSFTPPQEYTPMRKQVSRLCFILLGRLPAVMQWLLCPFVRFTVTGVARNSHPYSLGRLSPASALIGRRCTRYSFSYSIVWIASRVKFYLSNALGTSHFSRFVIPCYRDQNGRILYG